MEEIENEERTEYDTDQWRDDTDTQFLWRKLFRKWRTRRQGMLLRRMRLLFGVLSGLGTNADLSK